jgi:hypothetical protein
VALQTYARTSQPRCSWCARKIESDDRLDYKRKSKLRVHVLVSSRISHPGCLASPREARHSICPVLPPACLKSLKSIYRGKRHRLPARMFQLPGISKPSERVVMFVDESFHCILLAFVPEELTLVSSALVPGFWTARNETTHLNGKNGSPRHSWKQNNKPHPASGKNRSERAVPGRTLAMAYTEQLSTSDLKEPSSRKFAGLEYFRQDRQNLGVPADGVGAGSGAASEVRMAPNWKMNRK